jgi:hypothetical protein
MDEAKNKKKKKKNSNIHRNNEKKNNNKSKTLALKNGDSVNMKRKPDFPEVRNTLFSQSGVEPVEEFE